MSRTAGAVATPIQILSSSGLKRKNRWRSSRRPSYRAQASLTRGRRPFHSFFADPSIIKRLTLFARDLLFHFWRRFQRRRLVGIVCQLFSPHEKERGAQWQ